MGSDYKQEITELFNKQLNLEFKSFYFYRACASYCQDPAICYPGLQKYFLKQEKEELLSVKLLIDHMYDYGIKIVYKSIDLSFNPKDIKELLKLSLTNENEERENVMKMYKLGNENNDYETCIFLENFIKRSATAIRQINEMILRFERCENNVGQLLFDQTFVKK